jgi:hypothetical protein
MPEDRPPDRQKGQALPDLLILVTVRIRKKNAGTVIHREALRRCYARLVVDL